MLYLNYNEFYLNLKYQVSEKQILFNTYFILIINL